MNNPPLILLVDDEPEDLEVYSLALKQAGFDVVTGSNGVECVKLAKEKHPDLILLDVKMPVMDGLNAFLELRKYPETEKIKVVFLTAFGDPLEPMVNLKTDYGITADFIQKGVSLDEFIEKIKIYFKM
jgi:two-component system alkaline phosphatase synthesis response regulator PhoP